MVTEYNMKRIRWRGGEQGSPQHYAPEGASGVCVALYVKPLAENSLLKPKLFELRCTGGQRAKPVGCEIAICQFHAGNRLELSTFFNDIVALLR